MLRFLSILLGVLAVQAAPAPTHHTMLEASPAPSPDPIDISALRELVHGIRVDLTSATAARQMLTSAINDAHERMEKIQARLPAVELGASAPAQPRC